MVIKNKVVKITSNAETVLLQPTTNTVIKNLSIVFLDTTNIKTVNLYVKENSSSDRGSYLYKQTITKDWIYLKDLFLWNWNILSIEVEDLASWETVDVILQYIEL